MKTTLSSYYGDVYRSHLLPCLGIVMRNKALDSSQRVEAIKYFSDGSLALAGAGSEWSCALSSSFTSERQEKQAKSMMLFRRSSTKSSLFKRQSSCIWRPRNHFRRARISVTSCCKVGTRIKGRVQQLQKLVPGGNKMKDSRLLIHEALDYAMFLELQVGFLASLLAAATG